MFYLTSLICVFLCGTVFPASIPFYRELSEEEATRLATWNDTKEKQNIWELSGQTEGDMIIPTNKGRNGLINTVYRWPNKEIPYVLDSAFSTYEVGQINVVLTYFAMVSCLTVRPKVDTDVDYVMVTRENSGCWSYVGRRGGAQQLNIQVPACFSVKSILHEFLHAAGFHHQQSSTERDDYVTIMWDNIKEGKEKNFNKHDTTNFGQGYDYNSLMHYSPYAFSANGEATIVPKKTSALTTMGYVTQMSEIDKIKLNLMYNCTTS